MTPTNEQIIAHGTQHGMTLRDYFAGQALAGILAASGDKTGSVYYDEHAVARSAWEMADDMIAARKKVQP